MEPTKTHLQKNNLQNIGQKYNFLFVSIDGYSGDLAWHVSKEGHNVLYYTESESQKDIFDGFVKKTDDWKKEINWANVIVFDDVLGQGDICDDLRKKGKYVIGGTNYTDKLEDDRSFGQEEMKKAGITILDYTEFNSFDDAISYVTKNPGRYVIKPSGEAQNLKELLYVGEEKNGNDVILMLQEYKKTMGNRIPVFQLQKRVVGVEIGVGAFFNGKKFLKPININFEHKRLFPGNIGPFTGEMGTSMFWAEHNKIFDNTLKKMETQIAKSGYAGYIDINCIVNKDGIFPLEFTARFGYPTISIQIEGMKTPVGEFLFNLASGKEFDIEINGKFHIGVRIVVPPFPYDNQQLFLSTSKGKIINFKDRNLAGVHIEDVMLNGDNWVITGTTGMILIIAASGKTMEKTRELVYKRVENVIIPNMYYRNDIGKRWKSDYKELKNLKLI